MDDAPGEAEARRTVRYLRALVTALAVVMGAGVISLVALLVTRLPDGAAPLPDAVTLPDGTVPLAFTRGPDWMAIATRDAILVYDMAGTLRQRVAIDVGG